MYVVIDKQTKELIWKNPAPLTQNLTPKQVYHLFDENTMVLGKCNKGLPNGVWHINDQGFVIAGTLEENVEEGFIVPLKGKKAVGNEWIDMTLSEKIESGQLVLKDDEKYDKDKDQIVKKTIIEKLSDKLITLNEAKEQLKKQYSDLSFIEANKILPQYKQINCSLGVYDEPTTDRIKRTIEAFRTEYYRLETFIDSANSVKDLKKITPNFPTGLV